MRSRFFLRQAFASVCALIGFVGFILSAAPIVYALGAGVSLVGYWRLAPTWRQVVADQAALSRAGCDHDLVQLLG